MNRMSVTGPSAGVWVEFYRALDAATHVLVVGHSLQDAPLVEALTRNRGSKVAVIRPNATKSDLKSRVPKATPLDFGFGPDEKALEEFAPAVETWANS